MSRPLTTRARILRTAAEQFQAMGYQRTSLQAIAAQLGLTKATILYHFPTKAHLAAELVEPMVTDLEAAAEAAAAQPAHRRASAMIEGWLDTALQHRELLRMLIHDLSLLSSHAQYDRLLAVNARAIAVISGQGAGRRERVRAVQCIAIVSDPVVYHADVDPVTLRADIMDGVRRFLGRPSPRPRTDHGGPAVPRHPVPVRRGRPAALSDDQVRSARAMYEAGSHTVDEIAARFGVARATLYRHLRRVSL